MSGIEATHNNVIYCWLQKSLEMSTVYLSGQQTLAAFLFWQQQLVLVCLCQFIRTATATQVTQVGMNLNSQRTTKKHKVWILDHVQCTEIGSSGALTKFVSVFFPPLHFSAPTYTPLRRISGSRCVSVPQHPPPLLPMHGW